MNRVTASYSCAKQKPPLPLRLFNFQIVAGVTTLLPFHQASAYSLSHLGSGEKQWPVNYQTACGLETIGPVLSTVFRNSVHFNSFKYQKSPLADTLAVRSGRSIEVFIPLVFSIFLWTTYCGHYWGSNRSGEGHELRATCIRRENEGKRLFSSYSRLDLLMIFNPNNNVSKLIVHLISRYYIYI